MGRRFSEPVDGTLPVTGVVAVGVVASFLSAGCYHHANRRVPVAAASEPVVLSDIRGVVFKEEAGGGEVRYSEVSDVHWLPEALEIDGRVDAPGSPDHGRLTTLAFPYEDVSRLLVAPHPNREDVRGVRGAASFGGMLGGSVGFLLVVLWWAAGGIT